MLKELSCQGEKLSYLGAGETGEVGTVLDYLGIRLLLKLTCSYSYYQSPGPGGA